MAEAGLKRKRLTSEPKQSQPEPLPPADEVVEAGALGLEAEVAGDQVQNLCPPCFYPDGTRAPGCRLGSKMAKGHKLAGYAHGKTCVKSRTWSWKKLGDRAEACKAVVARWEKGR